MLKTVLSRGVLHSAKIVFNRVVPERWCRFRVFRVFVLVPAAESRHGDHRGEPHAEAENLSIRWCESPEDFACARELTSYRDDESSSAHCACLAFEGTDPVGGVWCATGAFEEFELGIRISLEPGQSWIFAAFVAKTHRRRGIYRRMLDYALADDSQTFFVSIEPINKASMAAHAPFIRQTLGTCVAIRVLGWSKCWAHGDLYVHGHNVTIGKQTTSMADVADPAGARGEPRSGSPGTRSD